MFVPSGSRSIAPQVVFRRLKCMGLFFALGAIGIAASVTLIGRDLPVSEPARLLTAFGFVAAAVVIVATVFSAGLLLWGGFIGQYVANLDSKAEVLEMSGLEEVPAYAVALEATKATGVIMQTVTANVAAVAYVIEQVAAESLSGEVGDLRKELLAMEVTFKRIEDKMSVDEQQRANAYLQRLLQQYDAAATRRE